MTTTLKSSKTLLVLAFSGLLIAGPAFAANEHDHGGHGAAAPETQAPTSTAMTGGVVKKVDKAAGKVTLSHGALVNLGMTTPMTMVFRVKDSAWLDQMKEGDKIRFFADNADGAITILRWEAAK